MEKAQGTEEFFRQLAPLLTAVLNTVQPAPGHEPLGRFAELVLPAVERESGIVLPAGHLADVCRGAVQDIWATVPRSSRRSAEGDEQPGRHYATSLTAYQAKKAAETSVEGVLQKLGSKLERFHGRVLESLIQGEVDQVGGVFGLGDCVKRPLYEAA